MDDPLVAITEILRNEHGISPAKLHPSARLGHDLGVDGDDVSDLLQRLHDRFGTDFSALNEHWTEFFYNEGMSLRSVLIGLALVVLSTALTLWITVALELSTSTGGLLGVAVFFALWIGIGRLMTRTQKRPVTIEGLADVVRSGAWPTDPKKVR